MAWEVGHVGALLQIPNLDLRVSGTGPKNETIRVELSASESCGVQTETLPPSKKFRPSNRNVTTQSLTTAGTFISNFGEDSTGLDVRKGPVLQNKIQWS